MIRCSSLPRLLACPGSMLRPAAPYDPVREVAEEGTDLHEQAAEAIEHGPGSRDALAEKAAEFWRNHSRGATPIIEQALQGDLLRGHPDAFGLLDEIDADAILCDWKFGYIHRPARDQLLGYAVLLKELHGVDVVEAHAYWPRLGITDTYLFDADDRADFARRLDEAERMAGNRYAPGQHCTYCPHQLACQARSDHLAAGVQALTTVDRGEITPAKLVELWPKFKAAEKALAAYKDAVKAALNTGAITHGGHRLRLEQRNQERLVAHKAKAVVLQTLPADTWDKACSVSKTALVDAVKAGAKRGQKKKAADALLADLRAAGAISTSQTEVINYEQVIDQND